jgi:cytochrome c oxidase subunit 1
MSAITGTLPGEAAAIRSLKAPALAFILTAFAAMVVGSAFGPSQALNYANINVYGSVPTSSYYQGLTIHGVLNGLVFTTFFNTGVLFYFPARELRVRVNVGWIWFSFIIMAFGLLMSLETSLTNQASVLYTFYTPLKAAPPFYIGLALVVVGSLMVAAETIRMRMVWKRENPGRVTPLVSYMSVAVWLLWALTSIGIVAELVFWVIPWSLGFTKGIDPLLTFTLFWYTGHAIVYFWVLPAYISWYVFVPHEAGGRLISDTLARLTFLMFLMFSIEVGLHHETTVPGVAMGWKMEQMFFTFLIIPPSLLTAFTVGASLETAGHARGGRGWIGWFTALPWDNPSVAGQVLAMLTFILGGATGILLASMPNDAVVHDTAFIPGHFHITVGTATALSFIAMSYWLIPHLTGRKLYARKLALVSVWLWAVGMMGIGIGLMWQGLYGTPRRDWISALAPDPFIHPIPMAITAAAGLVLLASLICFVIVTVGTLASRPVPAAEIPHIPFGNAVIDETSRWVLLMDRLGLWTLVTFVIILLVYGPVFFLLLTHQVSIAPNTAY